MATRKLKSKSVSPPWAKWRAEGKRMASLEGMTYPEFLIREQGRTNGPR